MTAIFITLYVICGAYMLLNFKRDIHAFQLNSYRISRYWRWLRHGNLMPAWRLTDVALIFLLLTPFMWVGLIAVPITLIVKSIMILTAKYKKPLAFTERVIRLYCCTGIIATALYAALTILIVRGTIPLHLNAYFNETDSLAPVVILLLMTTFSWAFVMLGAIVISPCEAAINRHYYNDAARMLRSMPDMKIIGITGSYGKTSTKHYLQRILSEKFEVLMTPGSFNTPMGVIRTVREMLKPYHEIFICEMGAKQTGDIKEICDLVHPQMGIITAVGPMHLETFKSIENVQRTKFELADALPADGLVVINNDFPYSASREVENVEAIRYGISNTENVSYTVDNIVCTPEGTDFTVIGPNDLHLDLHTRLIGESNLSNLTAAVIIALKLGVSHEQIRKSVEHIDQVEHRLSMKKTPAGVTIIDDAYNSNPVGSRMAVEALGKFKDGRRIIITPGMIELGNRQYELNKEFGKHIARNVDIAIIVGEYNRKAISDGIKESNVLNEDSIYYVSTFMESQQLLNSELRMTKGDTVLYENDLPDTFK